MPQAIPLLFVGDSPELNSGLARIGRDLASLLSRSPRFRVGYLGLGGVGTRQLPFTQYAIQRVTGQFGENDLERVWKDFAGNRTGIVFTIWDATRLTWFACPHLVHDYAPALASFLMGRHFQRWGYFPIDSTGPENKLTGIVRDTIAGYDRVLCYSRFARDLVARSLNGRCPPLDWMPHGINSDIFYPRDRAASRLSLGVHDNDYVIGVVATNQARKDWGLVAATISVLRAKIPNLRLWAHIDVLERHWSLPALLNDFSIGDITIVTHTANDETLATWYSACDVTLHPGLGEGFCYPIAESFACGVPAIHGDYGGGAEIVPEAWRIAPVAWRLDTTFNCLRPVFEPRDWVARVLSLRDDSNVTNVSNVCTDAVAHLAWKSLWPTWERWFDEGVQ